MTDHPIELRHRKHPEYDRTVKPGLFRYPRGVTAPIKWENDPASLIDFGGRGTMWQHNAPDGRHVRFKRDGEPSRAEDGDIVYTRRAAFPGEQYLIVGVYPDGVRTLRSFTPDEALWNNLQEVVLDALGVLAPQDFTDLAAKPDAARRMAQSLETAAKDHADDLRGISREGLDALLGVDPALLMKEVEALPAAEREALASGKTDPSTLQIVRKVLEGVGIAIPLIVTGICVIATLLVCVLVPLGPASLGLTWAAAGVVAAVAGLIAMIGGVVGGLLLLINWVLGFFE
jgi:hypothetical protein